MSNDELQILRRINLDWTVMLQGVWKDRAGDVPAIHQNVRADFVRELESLASPSDLPPPTGWVIVGGGGRGKTHLLSRFRAECAQRNAYFVLVDMTDVRDFWDTVLLGYFTSLQEALRNGRPQYEHLIEAFLGQIKSTESAEAIIRKLQKYGPGTFRSAMDRALGALRHRLRAEVNLHGDVIRAIVALNSDDYAIANVGNAWLQGEEIDVPGKQLLGMTKCQETSPQIVRGLSWLMSLNGPSIVALDQLDPIVTQLKLEHDALESTPALAIINKLGAGLSELRDVTRRTLVVVSCVDRTWKSIDEFTPKQFTDRYHPPRVLESLNSEQSVAALVSERTGPIFKQSGFTPPYQTWPFRESWLRDLVDLSPREILKKCQLHINECVRRGEVRELPPGWSPSPTTCEASFAELDARFAKLRMATDTKPMLDEKHEDDLLGEVIRSALRCVVKEVTIPDKIDVAIDETFTGAKTAKPLHARLRLVFPHEESREEHFCLRALQRSNASAFKARLRSAITQAGIDKALKFRRLVILRKSARPGGNETIKVTKEFDDFGGVWVDPSADDLKTMEALRLMEKDPHPCFPDWLQARQYASKTKLIRNAIPGFFESIGESVSKPTPPLTPTPPPPPTPTPVPPPTPIPVPPPTPTPVPPPTPPLPPTPTKTLTLGRRLIGDKPATQAAMMPAEALRKHGAVFAGAGSGKTVLLKRLIEDAALLGIPSIAIDAANDLAAIGDRWSSPPPEWSAGDAELAETFFTTTECVIWTPGRDSGNPIGLEPLPDLTALVGDPEELGEAIDMAVEALGPVLLTGPKAAVPRKQAILTNAFKFLSANGECNLEGLGAALRDFPDTATARIANEKRIARDMADSLFAQLAINPLLRSEGPLLNPAVLFGAGRKKTRISVVSLVGLATLDGQRQFLNQLAMALFAWVKKNPAPADVPLRGLLVIDEARDFVPSMQASACLGSIQRLAAQARKYGLGLIVATQNPKGIDNTIVAQCSTQWYGKMSAIATIDAAAEILKARGASSGDDVASLKAGRFYVSNAEYVSPPAKLMTPMCLSRHAGPLEREQVIERARLCRERLGAS